MTDFTTYNDSTLDASGDWFAEAIAPQTCTVERPRFKLSPLARIGSGVVFAVGISGPIQDPPLPDLSPCHGSSTVFASQDGIRTGIIEHVSLPDPVQQLSTVQTRLGLTKVGLARACRVERQTIYDWYKEKSPPTGDNARRLNALFRIADTAIKSGLPTLDPRLSGRILTDGQTLPELLSAEVLDQTAINQAINELAQQENTKRARSARSIRERLGWKEPSQEQQNANLDYNLGQRRQG